MNAPGPEEEKRREKERLKAERAKTRKAKSAARKLRKIADKLSDAGELTEWEEEFSEGVTERLDKFGSAFKDPDKGRKDEPLSYAQKAILSQLRKKQKAAEKSAPMKRSGFKSKRPTYKSNTRQLDEDFDPVDMPDDIKPEKDPRDPARQAPPGKRPFLRIVKKPGD